VNTFDEPEDMDLGDYDVPAKHMDIIDYNG
jgi:hypothetical protein